MSTATTSLPVSSGSVQATYGSSREFGLTQRSSTGRAEDVHATVSEAAGDFSAATERLRAQVRTVAPHFRTALISGERGARKEEVARALHAASPVAKGPFVVCDSGWMESLLRGYGAAAEQSEEDRAICRNLARAAHGGTVFFPELGLFSLVAQAEVLHFLTSLQKQHGQRIRVIASVSGDVQAMVAGKTLRADLREKIGVIELAVAPLRERVSDLAAVAARILRQIAERSGGEAATISEEALRELQRRGWPGNDRELESALLMATLTSGGGVIEIAHLPPATERAVSAGKPATLQVSSMRLQDVVDAHVQEVLRSCEGNKLKAAEVLGISRSTLYRMLDAVSVTT